MYGSFSLFITFLRQVNSISETSRRPIGESTSSRHRTEAWAVDPCFRRHRAVSHRSCIKRLGSCARWHASPMLHFPSSLQSTAGGSGSGKRDTLNATQQKRASHPVLLQIENELHDARRVHSHGQEDDLRQALDMVIRRLSEVVRCMLVCAGDGKLRSSAVRAPGADVQDAGGPRGAAECDAVESEDGHRE